jgi:hypothetical protein
VDDLDLVADSVSIWLRMEVDVIRGVGVSSQDSRLLLVAVVVFVDVLEVVGLKVVRTPSPAASCLP